MSGTIVEALYRNRKRGKIPTSCLGAQHVQPYLLLVAPWCSAGATRGRGSGGGEAPIVAQQPGPWRSPDNQDTQTTPLPHHVPVKENTYYRRRFYKNDRSTNRTKKPTLLRVDLSLSPHHTLERHN